MSENQEISLNSVKKLIATKCPSVKIKNPALNAISICAENFIELLVQGTATVSNDKQKNLIVQGDVIEALDQLGFPNLSSKAKEVSSEITENIKNQKESWKALKIPENNLTQEEADREIEKLRDEALKFLEQKRKEEQESSKAKGDS